MRSIIVGILFLFSTYTQAQPQYFNPMNIFSILYNLDDFRRIIPEAKEIAKKRYGKELSGVVYQSYTFIEVRLYEAPDSDRTYQQLYAHCKFKIENGGKIVLEEVYCDQKETEKQLEQFIHKYMNKNVLFWHTETPADISNTYFSGSSEALFNADLIAKEGYLCDHSYSPGYYSEILIRENCIELFQVNRRNSRSSDHKDNYYLRDVKFTIPLNGWIPEDLDYSYSLKDLYINFRDSSSPQNKECGNRMIEKIKELK